MYFFPRSPLGYSRAPAAPTPAQKPGAVPQPEGSPAFSMPTGEYTGGFKGAAPLSPAPEGMPSFSMPGPQTGYSGIDSLHTLSMPSQQPTQQPDFAGRFPRSFGFGDQQGGYSPFMGGYGQGLGSLFAGMGGYGGFNPMMMGGYGGFGGGYGQGLAGLLFGGMNPYGGFSPAMSYGGFGRAFSPFGGGFY